MTYEEFENVNHDEFLWLREENMDIGGGKISRADLDQIQQYPNWDKVMVTGLQQDTFEYFMKTYGDRLRYVSFWKNKSIEDLSILGQYPNLEYVHFFLNQKTEKLWDMSGNTRLSGLRLENFSRLSSLDGVQTAPHLKHLAFGDAIWSTHILNDIQALYGTHLESFHFYAKKIEHIDILEFTKMPDLQKLDFRTNLFSTEEIAMLMAKAPHLSGYALRPLITFERRSDDENDVLIVGKRKPFLNSQKDCERIKKYEKKFYQLIEHYKNN